MFSKVYFSPSAAFIWKLNKRCPFQTAYHYQIHSDLVYHRML
jgi:hypothetical protein